jgi:hypothetical protein
MGSLIVPDSKLPDGRSEPKTFGEQYLPGIGEWFGRTTEGNSLIDRVEWKWCGDGIAIEGFKAMKEIVLNQAYVLERADGSFMTWNCSSCSRDAQGVLTVEPAEKIVTRVHLNLQNPGKVIARFAGSREKVSGNYSRGMHWIGPGGKPEELR